MKNTNNVQSVDEYKKRMCSKTDKSRKELKEDGVNKNKSRTTTSGMNMPTVIVSKLK